MSNTVRLAAICLALLLTLQTYSLVRLSTEVAHMHAEMQTLQIKVAQLSVRDSRNPGADHPDGPPDASHLPPADHPMPGPRR